MNTAKRPRDDGATLRRLVDEGARVRPLSQSERKALLAQLEQRLESGARTKRARLVVPLVAALSLLVGALFQAAPRQRASTATRLASQQNESASAVQRAPAPAAPAALEPAARKLSLGGRGELVLEPGAVAQLPPDLGVRHSGPVRIELASGRLSATVAPRAADEPLSIVTPQLVVVVIGTRFSVAVEAAMTTVAVEHGRVRVERAGRAIFVDGGQSIRSDDARFESTERAQAKRDPVRSERCSSQRSSVQYGSCLRRLSSGSGLSAENALLSLALLERDQRRDREAALARLEEYERRFPRGMLTREVALATVRTLLAAGRKEQACAYAHGYTRRFPDDASTAARLRAGCER